MTRWRRYALYGLLVTGLAAVPALGTKTVYANGNLGAGGSWLNPVHSNASMTYNRMSTANPGDVVHVRFENTSGTNQGEAWSYQFIQNGSSLPISSRGWCFNDGSYTESGYCAWYN